MSYNRNKSWCLVMGIMLAVFSAVMLLGFTQAASAEGRGRGHDRYRSMDSRHNHGHAYPVRGHYVDALPRGHHVMTHGHSQYHFSGGVWYRPYGPRFVVIAPPMGLIVPFLPLYYTTLWVGGSPYYYANEVYYTQTSGGYAVVEPPKGEVTEAPAEEERLFIYPRKGQSEKQQSDDRYACHRWAVDQTNYDPTQPPGSSAADQLTQKRSEYQRATSACLDARGYTAK